MNSRKNIQLLGESEDNLITVLKPISTEHENKFIVLYENAYGDVDIHVMTPKAIINNFSIPEDELWEFIDSLKVGENDNN